MREEERCIQWDVEKHDSVRFGKLPSVRSDLVKSLPSPDRSEILSTVRRKWSFNGFN